MHTRNLPLLHSKRKLAPRWLGPFRISARRGTNAYLLDGLPPWIASVHPVFNVSQLKPYNLPDVSTPSDLPGRVSTPTRPDEPSTEDDASAEFEVDFIKEDMAPEDNTSSDGRTLDQKMIPGSQKTTYNMPHVFCNGGRNSNSIVLLLED